MTAPVLTTHVERYVSLRQALGFKLHAVAREPRAYASYAEARGDTFVRLSTATGWAEQAPSPRARHVRLRRVAGLARFLRAEDPAHEVPPAALFHVAARRPLPHIYTPEQFAQIVAAAGLLRETYTLRRRIYATLFGMIAATGLRISEALVALLANVGPKCWRILAHLPSLNLGFLRFSRGARSGLERQSGIVRAAPSGA